MVHDDIVVPEGEFTMGDPFDEGCPADGEMPQHRVRLAAFRMDRFPVTVHQFAAFVVATGHVTDAERFGSSAVFYAAYAGPPGAVLGRSTTAPWWLEVAGATWMAPNGPDPTGAAPGIGDLEDHPVTHVAYNDALAYCEWAGRRLPTEAEWEYAARGGLEAARYPWGDDLRPGGTHRCNIWQGEFPRRNTLEDGWATTNPAGAFEANGFGLYDVAGNVWEWCADWFDPSWYSNSPLHNPLGPGSGDRRVTRGGSYLCHASYCQRYRVAARSGNPPDSSAANLGFRTVAS